MFGDRFSSSTSCSRGVHETEPDRPDQSLTCCFLKVATHPARGLLKRPDVRPEIIFVEPLSKGADSSCKLREICTEAKNIPVVVLSISRDPHNIVAAIKAGAEDYVYKPVETKSLCQTILSILESKGNSATVERQHTGQEVDLVCSSPQMRQIHQTSLQIAKTNVPVLIQGESGVGKDVVARLIHQKSSLCDRTLCQSELCSHAHRAGGE